MSKENKMKKNEKPAKKAASKMFLVTCVERHEVALAVSAKSPKAAIKKAKLGEGDGVVFMDSEAVGEVDPKSYCCDEEIEDIRKFYHLY